MSVRPAASFRPAASLRPAALVGLGSLLVLGSCDSGADVGTFSGGSPPLTPLAVDFDLRTDVYLGAAMTSDAIPIDLDGDGRMDVVEANFLDGTIRVALQDPLGGFALSQVVPGGGGAVWRLGKGDVDGDGLMDVVAVEVANEDVPGSSPAVTAFLQDAPGHFGPSVSLPLAAHPIDLDLIPGGGLGGGALIAAGAVVREGFRVPPRSLVAGVPAKVLRAVTEAEIEAFRASAEGYVRKVRLYLPVGAALG